MEVLGLKQAGQEEETDAESSNVLQPRSPTDLEEPQKQFERDRGKAKGLEVEWLMEKEEFGEAKMRVISRVETSGSLCHIYSRAMQ
ncbi:hypothetical protein N7513_009392 [Penicillium frequentans]|nr:hypothetical protein N7513_009392 [Penicillium glabrum]